MSSRQRWFCRFCGGLTQNRDGVCRGHRDLVELDTVDVRGVRGLDSDDAADESRPVIQGEDSEARKGMGL
jgi:hypothetical protein